MNEPVLERVRTQLERGIRLCRKCGAVIPPGVPGEGNLEASILLFGRNPGNVENREGRPFVGPGGRALNSELSRIGLGRPTLWVDNMVRCYTNADRPPVALEISNCGIWTRLVFKAIKPRVIVPLGKQASEFLLGAIKWGEMRGRVHRVKMEWGEVLVFPVTHPGQALRGARQAMYEDFNNLERMLIEIGLK